MGCGSKLTTELLTWRTCPFLFAESNNKLVIRGHLLLPDNTYSEQEHSVGGQPGILAAVGSGSSVDCFTPRPELVLPSRGPAAGWEDAGGLGRRLFPRGALPCPRRARVPKPRGAREQRLVRPRCRRGGTLGVPPRLGAERLGETRRVPGSAFSFLPRFQEMQLTHRFLAPEPPRLKKNTEGDSV